MKLNKVQSKETEHAADLQKTSAPGKEDHREQDPGTGYIRSEDPSVAHLKNNLNRHRWEH